MVVIVSGLSGFNVHFYAANETTNLSSPLTFGPL